MRHTLISFSCYVCSVNHFSLIQISVIINAVPSYLVCSLFSSYTHVSKNRKRISQVKAVNDDIPFNYINQSLWSFLGDLTENCIYVLKDTILYIIQYCSLNKMRYLNFVRKVKLKDIWNQESFYFLFWNLIFQFWSVWKFF